MIQNQWYAILPASQVKKGQVLGVRRLSMDLALFRTAAGELGCVVDKCSHRGAALSIGTVHGDTLRCPFHGLTYSTEGECRQVPALGKATKQDISRFNVKFPTVREIYGIIYLWYGEGEPSEPLPFFTNELSEDSVYSEFGDKWNAFYSRCIENQLDVLHLPFVHHNTIGRGNKTLVNGPKVLFENHILVTSAENEVDTGQQPKPPEACTIRDTYLSFIFPNLWMNHISDKMRIVVYFAPVDQANTILYLRFYANVSSNRYLNNAAAFFGQFGNFIIERQDRRVVVTQRPKMSAYHSKENLLQGDGPVITYRRLRDKLKAGEEI